MSKAKDGVRSLVVYNSKILLTLRDNIDSIPQPNCWQIVGGGIEPGEIPEQAVARELTEEAGYSPEKFTFIGKYIGSSDQEVYVYLFVVDETESKKFFHQPGGEGQEIRFITPKEALGLKLTTGTRKLIEKNQKYIETGKGKIIL